MAYTTGAQGPTATDGAQGPTLLGSGGIQGLWGSQGQANAKPSPFRPNSASLDVTSVRLELNFTLRSGVKYVAWVNRTISADTDMLGKLPDDLVQMVNIINFRPRAGLYRTSAAPDGVVYRIAELGGFQDTLPNFINTSDPNIYNYVPAELGL